MSFLFYDIGFLAVFGVALFLFLYVKRKNLKREGILYLYRTKIGLRAIEYIGKKWGKFLNILKYIVIVFGYIAMIAMIYLLVKTIQIFANVPELVRAIKIPPIAPLIPYLPQIFRADYLPVFYFTYWIVVLAVVAIVHEFAHGIFAKQAGVRIKSTGFYFMGPFIGAFVEQDERQMIKAKRLDQLGILAAGSFSNAVFTVLFFLVFWLFFSLVFSASGVIFNTYAYELINKSDISLVGKNVMIDFDGGLNLTEIIAKNKTFFMQTETLGKLEQINATQKILVFEDSPALRAELSGAIIGINNVKINDYDELRRIISGHAPGDKVVIETLNIEKKTTKKQDIMLVENPKNKSSAYIGIAMIQPATSAMGKIRARLTFFQEQNTYYAPRFLPELMIFIKYLLFWMILINFSVALGNMLPVGIFDGGRFFYLTMLALTRKEKLAKKLFKLSTYLVLAVFILLMVLWATAIF